MPSPKAAMTQSELCRYMRAMRDAGFDGRVEIVRPDGTTVRIVSGRGGVTAADHADAIDKMIDEVPDAQT